MSPVRQHLYILLVIVRHLTQIYSETELPFLVAHLSLHAEASTTLGEVAPQLLGSGVQSHAMYGGLVSSVNQLKDLEGNAGLYFLFPDVSVRLRGRYRLGITLHNISRLGRISSSLIEKLNKPRSARPNEQGKRKQIGHHTDLCHVRTAEVEVVSLGQYKAGRKSARLREQVPN